MEQLSKVLRVDAAYRNTNNWRNPVDQFNSFFRFSDGSGINNTSGFRPKKKRAGGTDITDCAFCVLVTNFGETEWPDRFDARSGTFFYFGDNRKPGKAITDTSVGGNRLLEHVFDRMHHGDRKSVCPFLCFESFRGIDGMFMRFLGIAVPGAKDVTPDSDLVSLWRHEKSKRFQNYRALFTILDAAEIHHSWLDQLVEGVPAHEAEGCPTAFQHWVINGRYEPLLAEQKVAPRGRYEQLPLSTLERDVLAVICDQLTDRAFEYAAASLLGLMDSRFEDITVTRAVRDGGRDVLASYRVGHESHSVRLNVCLEAKKWHVSRAIGVRPMARLISRIRHRELGVFMTTSFFDKQVQQELIDDGHPIILLSGGDIARLLISSNFVGDRLKRWVKEIVDRSIS